MNSQDIDEIENLLLFAEGVKDVYRYNTNDNTFKRNITFSVRDVIYKITWFSNKSTFYVGDVEIKFTHLKYSDSWPNKFKYNLEFYYYNKIVAILGVVE